MAADLTVAAGLAGENAAEHVATCGFAAAAAAAHEVAHAAGHATYAAQALSGTTQQMVAELDAADKVEV